jgi:hypothetical protein
MHAPHIAQVVRFLVREVKWKIIIIIMHAPHIAQVVRFLVHEVKWKIKIIIMHAPHIAQVVQFMLMGCILYSSFIFINWGVHPTCFPNSIPHPFFT